MRSAFVVLDGRGFYIGFSGDRFDVASADAPHIWRYMPVTFYAPDMTRDDVRIKLMKTRIGAECGARGVYDFMLNCAHFEHSTDDALSICRHVLEHGRRMR